MNTSIIILLITLRKSLVLAALNSIPEIRTLNVFSDDDRHGITKPTYDQENPPPTKRPSSFPSKSPSLRPSRSPTSSPSLTLSLFPTTMPSKYTCKLIGDGNFGNTTGDNIAKETISFKFEAELNTTLLNSSSGNDDEKVEQEVIPSVESEVLDFLLPSMFPQCDGTDSNSAIPLLNVKGVSTQPKDVINERGCSIQDTSSGDCYLVDAGLSWYYDSSQRRQLFLNDEFIKQFDAFIKGAIKQLMDNGVINYAHPAIVKISYVETNSNPILKTPKANEKNKNSGNSVSFPFWQIGISIGLVGLAAVVGLYIWHKKKSTDTDDESDFDSSWVGNTGLTVIS